MSMEYRWYLVVINHTLQTQFFNINIYPPRPSKFGACLPARQEITLRPVRFGCLRGIYSTSSLRAALEVIDGGAAISFGINFRLTFCLDAKSNKKVKAAKKFFDLWFLFFSVAMN